MKPELVLVIDDLLGVDFILLFPMDVIIDGDDEKELGTVVVVWHVADHTPRWNRVASSTMMRAAGPASVPLRTCEFLNPHDSVGWRGLPPSNTDQSCLAATTLPHDRILVCGGHDGKTALSTVEIYDARSRRWDSAPDLPTACSEARWYMCTYARKDPRISPIDHGDKVRKGCFFLW